MIKKIEKIEKAVTSKRNIEKDMQDLGEIERWGGGGGGGWGVGGGGVGG